MSSITVVRILGKALEDDSLQVSGNSARSSLGGMTVSRTCAIMTSIGLSPRNGGRPVSMKIGDGAEPIDVGAAIGFLAAHDLLGGHVERRAGDRSFSREVRGFFVSGQRFDQPEIQQLGDVVAAAAIGCHEIRRLDVTVHEAGLVCFLKCVTGLREQVDHASGLHRAVALDQLGEAKSG